MKSYLEIKVPITFDAPWFVELRNSLKGMPVLWQRDYYHITMVFIDDTQNLPAIKAIMHKYLDNAKAITITFNKLDVFATKSGMLVVHLTTSSMPQTFQTLVNDIRDEIGSTNSKMQSGFRLHVTLGRISEPSSDIDDIGFLIDEIDLPLLTLTLNEVEYREFRGRSFYTNTLK